MRSRSLRPSDSLTALKTALSMGFRLLVSRKPAIQATGLLATTLVGLVPTENASLRWTHNDNSFYLNRVRAKSLTLCFHIFTPPFTVPLDTVLSEVPRNSQ